MRMKTAEFFYILFAIVSIVGGLIGFATKRSKASLIAGSISGVLLLVSAVLVPIHSGFGLTIGLVVSLLLAGRFIPAFILKHAIFPAGVMSLLSIVSVIVTLLAFYTK